MIASLTGRLTSVREDRVHLSAGPVVFEVLIPASDAPLLANTAGEEVTVHTLLYFEGEAVGGSMTPRLLGFLRREDKAFFEKFITVKGIGPKKALKALAIPAGDIAAAIEGKNARALAQLPGVGKRVAEQIVAELAGKVAGFAVATADGQARTNAQSPGRRSAAQEDALSTLVALGERRPDAEKLLDKVLENPPANAEDTQTLVREMLRLRSSR
ncbi:MAG: Holliday junction branch migration protein RuvA [Phycisphaerae bacterium]